LLKRGTGAWLLKLLPPLLNLLGSWFIDMSDMLPVLNRAILTAVDVAAPEKLAAVSRALYRRHWGEGKPVESPDVLAEVATAAGLTDVAALLARATDPAVKERLKKKKAEKQAAAAKAAAPKGGPAAKQVGRGKR